MLWADLQPEDGVIFVDSIPSGAAVFVNKEHEGSTPLLLQKRRRGKPFTLKLVKNGYQDEVHKIKGEELTWHKWQVAMTPIGMERPVEDP